MAHSHDHSHGANERGLKIALALTFSYLIVEVVGGVMVNSLALLSDAAHMLTDVSALVIAILAIRIGKRPADRKRTFGYYRFEILAAAANASMLIIAAGYIFYEAYRRLFAPPEIHSLPLIIVASIGLLVNLISMKVLHAGSQHSLNMKGAYLEVWSDAVGSVAVIVGALVIRFTGWSWIDPLLAVLIGCWVLPRTWTLLSESINVLLEGVPEGLQLEEIEQELLAIPGVRGVHDLHVWAITSGKNSLTTHLVLLPLVDPQIVLDLARESMHHRFAISHTTIQVESKPCGPADPPCFPEASHAGHAHDHH